MRIKELPPLLRELALRRMKEDDEKPDPEEDLGCAFSWHNTPEDCGFWSEVEDGDFEAAKQECPHLAHLFEENPKAKPVSIGEEEPMLKINIRKK